MNQPLALVIDDEPDICELLTLTLGRMDIRTETAMDVSGAKTLLGKHDFDICLTDMRLPDGDGLELVEWMQANATGVPVAVITAHGNVETAVQALKLGAFDFISKPLDLGNLRTIVEKALRVRTPGQNGGSKLLGESERMHDLREMISKVAQSQAPVHISGESGTGKELVARLIHDSGPRADGPFVPVNCGAIPAELVESEFFGHRKGSFTGAVYDKAGLVQCARDGTLFLDEIADLPLAMQVKLLRVIQEKKVRPVGASQEEGVDVRILSATHKNLSTMVADGEFREDLYYRINVIELHVPALRKRGGDVLLLADHILQRLGATGSLDESAREALLSYAFPGNVRELENMLERAVTLCASGSISASDLNMRQSDGAEPAQSAFTGKLGEQVEDVQRQAIVEALEKTRYNKTAAAKLLGLSFRQLRYRIKKLGIE
ncbi:MAG: sigma-54 dependent transcriptional regulator [Gammaproteobacteria bacterium]|jgi:two-component system response regulator PilR (NtrC family)|nr:sigma-54 dependent transcriptional regulator [Gammaproteobacteria bacterium]MDH3759012.1 sigma-54 dependent transcriptional regulator [Gammaproteobacteria bacterium]MDH3821957.1 sigma-54 dependent transcriptional regulator [Gammaproteobacteria bacterium]MDH3984772.1 sigma-54 dependent transcriptional regulator [Gammaproteobacteria bacterium]HKJ20996.1 sigma-54 dependent transcriptional regulator [Woeseiaceae bacterium]